MGKKDQRTLNRACELLAIDDLWRVAGYIGEPKHGGAVSSPFREDRHPSFFISSNGKFFRDYAREKIDGGVWNFARFTWPNETPADLAKRLIKLAGLKDNSVRIKPQTKKFEDNQPSIKQWPDRVKRLWFSKFSTMSFFVLPIVICWFI